MGKDYYALLGISKDASEDELKKAYKKAALKHHPDRNKGSEASAKKFKDVGEAFEVLSDSNKRAVYDQFGEEGLKAGAGAPGGAGGAAGGNPFAGFSSGGAPGGFSFSTGGGSGGGFRASDPNDIFSQFFSAMGGGGGGGGGFSSGGFPGMRTQSMDMDEDDNMGGFGGFGGGFPGGMPGGRPAGNRQRTSSFGSAGGDDKPLPELIKPLPVSLEDLYAGTTKKMKITRKLADGSSQPKILEIKVMKGWKSGTKIRYKGAGNEAYGRGMQVKTQDVVFEVQEKPHDLFKRDGDNLLYTLRVPLVEALAGPSDTTLSKKSLTTLDKRVISYTVPYPSSSGGSPLKPGQEIRVKGEGMPSKTGKGDLIVKLEIVFPARLTGQQISTLKGALS